MNILIIGLGSIAKKHIAALRSIDENLRLYAYRSSKSTNSIYGVMNLFSWDEVRENYYDFAIVSNSTAYHQSSIEKLLDLNIPLFIEKPLYHLLSIESTVKKVSDSKIINYVACNLRFLDSLIFTKRYIENSNAKINEVNIYCGSYLPEWRKDNDYKKNYSAIPEMGGGVHIDLIHEVDYVYWFFGLPVKTSKVFSNKSNLNIEAYDYANYCLEYSHFCVSVILNYYRRDSKRTLEIVLEDETILVDLLKNEVKSNDKIIYKSEQTIIDTYQSQMKYFIDSINKTNTLNDVNDAFNVLKICLEK